MSENSSENADFYWFATDDGVKRGPFTKTEFSEKLAAGEIDAGTLVWRTGEADWARFGAVRGAWFPEAAAPERITPEVSAASVFSNAWSALFFRRNFWLLLAGGVLWWFVGVALDCVTDVGSKFLTPFAETLVFLSVVRLWDRGEAATFADMFPLKRLFFLPWLRALAASAIVVLPVFLLLVLALASLVAPLASDGARLEAALENLEKAAAPLAEAAEEIDPDDPGTQLDRILAACDETDWALVTDGYAGTAGAVALACAFLFFCAACWLEIRLGFAPYLALDAERTNPFAALKNAWLITRGKFLRVLFVEVCLALFVLVGAAMTLGLGLLVLLPFAYLANATLCVKLMKARPDLALPPSHL